MVFFFGLFSINHEMNAFGEEFCPTINDHECILPRYVMKCTNTNFPISLTSILEHKDPLGTKLYNFSYGGCFGHSRKSDPINDILFSVSISYKNVFPPKKDSHQRTCIKTCTTFN